MSLQPMTPAPHDNRSLPTPRTWSIGERGIRVMVVDDHPIARKGLQAMVESDVRLQWAGGAANGSDALQMALAEKPDVMVLDLDVSDLDALEVMGSLKHSMANVRFVLMATRLEPVLVRRALAMDKSSVLLKSADTAQLTDAIVDAHFGHFAHAPEIDQMLAPNQVDPGAELTVRERELLVLLVRGLSNRDIASQMGIAMPTVKYHMTKIMTKLQASNRTSVVLTALRYQLVDHE